MMASVNCRRQHGCTGFLVLLLFCLTFMSQAVTAACPETTGTSLPVVYQDCVELINLTPAAGIINFSTSAATEVGDYQVLVVVRKSTSNTAVINAPAGWTAILGSTRNGANGNNDVVMAVYARFATAAGAEVVPIQSSSGNDGNDILIWAMRFSNTAGYDSAVGANATSAPTASAILVSPAITTTAINSLVLRLAGIDDDDIGALDTNVFGPPRIALSVQETGIGNSSVTGVAAYDIQAAIGTANSANADIGGSEEWIAHTLALLPQPYFLLSHPASTEACNLNVISIEARNPDGTVNTAYAGVVALSTSTAHGYWTTTGGDATGTLASSDDDTGTATYTFAAGDNGTVDLIFWNPHVESLDFNLLDGDGYRELKTVTNDSAMDFIACTVDPGYFSLSHPNINGMCSNTAVTISAVTGLGVVDTGYTGSVEFSALGAGNWSAGPGANLSFSNGAVDDGIATYTFAPADNGQVVLYFTPATVTTVNFDVSDTGDAGRTVLPFFDRDLAFEECEYRISHDGAGNTCSLENVTFALVTSSNAPVIGYTGSIALNTATLPVTTDKGTWTLDGGGAGTLTNNTTGSGLATYEFASADNGAVTLRFRQKAGTTVTFGVTGNAGLLNPGENPPLVIGTCAFRVQFTGDAFTDVCSFQEVTITAVDDMENLIPDFTGQVSLSTTTGHGTWTEGAVQPGTLADPVANDGSASYTFVAGDNGDVVLQFNDPFNENLRIDVSTLDNSMQVTTNALFDPLLTVNLCTFRLAFADGQLTACTPETVTLQVFNSEAVPALAVDYEGTVNFSTSGGNGTFAATSGSGVLLDPSPNDGAASYQFSAADNGAVTFTVLNATAETFSIDVEDAVDPDFREDGAYDPAFEVTSCLPSLFADQCYTSTSQLDAITIPAQSSALADADSRMVLMYIFTESTTASTNVRLTLGLDQYALTPIHQEASVGARLEVWGILGDDLPDGAASLQASYQGIGAYGSGPAMCLVSLEGVAQTLPVLATPAASGQLNGIAYDNVTNSSLDVTTAENNSLVISVIGTGERNATNMFSTLTTAVWDLNRTDPGAPVGSNWNGYSDPFPQAGAVTVTENTDGNSDNVAHIVLALAPKVAGAPFASGYVPVALFETLSGNISYRAIGNSLRVNPNEVGGTPPYVSSCTMAASSTSMLSIPAGSTIEFAQLYWAASGRTADLDASVTFGPTAGTQTSFTADPSKRFQILNVGTNSDSDFYLAFKDVTSLISVTDTTPGTAQTIDVDYTFSDLVPATGVPWSTMQSCLGGWSLVVVYTNVIENTAVNVVNLFHGFQPAQHNSFTLVPRNFRMPTPSVANNVPRGQITHVTFEGDNTINTGNELLELQNDPAFLNFEPLVNFWNTGTTQYNDTVTMPFYDPDNSYLFAGYQQLSTTSYGVDVDTYYIAGTQAVMPDPQQDILYPFGVAGAEQITTRHSAGQDLVLVAAEFISITNADLAELEVFVTPAGTFKVNSLDTVPLDVPLITFTIVNNGNSAVSNGFATGEVILTTTLPTGITMDADPLVAIDADPHWVCTHTISALTCTFNIETWTGGTFDPVGMYYQLDDGASLPPVQIAVNVGDETSFPLLSNPRFVVGRIAHVKTAASCNDGLYDRTPAGVQPDPTTCVKADQYDNVNDLNQNTLDIDDLSVKDVTNNNVDRGNFVVAGILTDLGIDKSVVGVLEQDSNGQYQLVVTNNGPDATSKLMTVADTFPAGLTPAGPFPYVIDDWTCNAVTQTLTCTRSVPLAVGASSVISVATGLITAVEGDVLGNTATVAAGTYNFDTNNTNNADTDVSEVVGQIVAFDDRFLLSVNEAATLGIVPVAFGPDDLVLYNVTTNEAEMFWDASAGITDIDALHLLPNGWIVFSGAAAGTFLGVAYQPEDLVLYDPILEEAELLFNGSDPGKFGGSANIDAVHIDHHDSWNKADWDYYLSTADAATLNGAPMDDNDVALYAAGGATTIFFNGADANKFNDASGDIGAFFIRHLATNEFVLATSDAGITQIDLNETFNGNDLIQYDNDPLGVDGSRASQVMDGYVAFGNSNATRRVDAIHVVEEGYYGHFAISTVNGDTCTAATVTITKHKALTHDADVDYEGSVLITNSAGSGSWLVQGGGTLTAQPGGGAIYTYGPADDGVVVLAFSQTAEALNVDIDVTNGIATEKALEDQTVSFGQSILNVNYLDDFSIVGYSGNDGNASWNGSWVEENDLDGIATQGAGDSVYVTSGELRMTDAGTPGQPAIHRDIGFNYDPNVATDPVTLKFRWGRNNGTTADLFQVQVNRNGEGWIPLGTYGGAATGTVAMTLETIDLTALPLALVAGDSLSIRFQVTSGYLVEYMRLDDVEVYTSSDSDCNPGVPLDHYHVSHAGSAVSCLASNIVVAAHDAMHNLVTLTADVVIDLATVATNPNTLAVYPDGGFWNAPVVGSGLLSPLVPTNTGVATYAFPGGENAVTLPFNYTSLQPDDVAVDVAFIVSSSVGEVESDVVSTPLSVARTGLRFFNVEDGNGTVPTLMSGADSFDYSLKTIVVQAVQATTLDPSVCEPLFDMNEVASIELVLECIDSATCADTNVLAAVTHKQGAGTTTTAVNTVDSNGGDWIAGADEAELAASPLNLEFESNGSFSTSYIRLNYADVGQMQLHARYDVPLNNDPQGILSGDYIRGSSNVFVVRPFGLDVDFDDDRRLNGGAAGSLSYAVDATQVVPFAQAGVPEPVTVSAVAYDPDDDLDGNWIPDLTADLANNVITRNFGQEADFNDKVVLSLMTDDPNVPGLLPQPLAPGNAVPDAGLLTGVPGVLATAPAGFMTFTAGRSTGNLTFNEVGIIDIGAELREIGDDSIASYKGTGAVTGGALRVGRFAPAYYEIVAANSFITERPGFSPLDNASSFTYLGEQFDVTLALQARSGFDAVTVNNFGDFANLDNTGVATPQFAFTAFVDVPAAPDVPYGSRLSAVNTVMDNSFVLTPWEAGEAGFTGTLVFQRDAAVFVGGVEEAPITGVSIAVSLLDSDLVEDQANVHVDAGTETDPFTHSLIGTNEFRYGRLRLENAYGSERQELEDDGVTTIGKDVAMRLVLEYWNGADFVLNSDDDLTALDSQYLTPVAGSFEDALAAGEFLKKPGVSVVRNGQTLETAATDLPFYFLAPGENNEGSVVMEYDLLAPGLDFLGYDWRAMADDAVNLFQDVDKDNDYTDNPRARLEFGTFRGNDRIINWQELFD